jgi:hypothetical protein
MCSGPVIKKLIEANDNQRQSLKIKENVKKLKIFIINPLNLRVGAGDSRGVRLRQRLLAAPAPEHLYKYYFISKEQWVGWLPFGIV